MPNQVFTVDEVAKILRIGRATAYEAVRRGEIPVVKIGRRLLVPRTALERLLSDPQKGPIQNTPKDS